MTLLYVIALLGAFYLLLIAEFFLPTGGLLGTAAAATLIATIMIAFSHSMAAGVAVLGFVLVTTPAVLFGMLRVWPHTPIGRRMLNRRPGELSAQPTQRTIADGTPIAELVGRIGTAKTDMLPSGMIVIEGTKLDAVSTGMPIDAGTTILVASVEGKRIHVRAATPDDLADEQVLPPQSPPSLEESLESFDAE